MSETAEVGLSDSPSLVLYRKLHEVAEAIKYIEKNGRNAHHQYDFVQAVDVTRVVRDELLERRIIVLPGASSAEHLAYGSKGGHLTTVSLFYRLIDIDTGATADIPWIGVGADTGGDKGIYKAFTGGLKYMLLATFLIPMTNDPERDQLTQREDQGGTTQTAAPAPAEHKDDARPAAPRIPMDRATLILKSAIGVQMAQYDVDGNPGDAPVFHPAFKALLALQGVSRIGSLNVDQAEAVEAWLRNEAASEMPPVDGDLNA